MTNTSEEMSGEVVMMPATSTASCEDPAMQRDRDGEDDDGAHTFPQDEVEFYEKELVIAVGNAAKAARRAHSQQGKPSLLCSLQANAKEGSHSTSKNDANNAAIIRDGMNDGNFTIDEDSKQADDGRTSTTKGEENFTLNGTDCEEECETYKTCSLATTSQSEQFIQQEKEELATQALISALSLFLVKAWNWLHYVFVTIIFLNLVDFAERRRERQLTCGDSVVIGEPSSVEVEGAERIESGKDFVTENSGKSDEIEEKMSPNTCSIQNTQQEVEKAEEAIAATATTVLDKMENHVSVIVITPPEQTPEVEEEEKAETIIVSEQQQITIILTEEDESDESEDNVDGVRRDSVDSCISSEGNLGDTEGDSCGKSEETESSNDNDSNCDAASVTSGEETGKEVAQKIVSQVESMFSDEHLAKDGFLLKHVRRRSDGFVSLKLVAGLRKVKQISRDFPIVLNALKDSTKLEINPEGTKVRRVEPLGSLLKSLPIKAKEKDQPAPKGKENTSSTEETQQNNKTGFKAGAKEGENGNRTGNQSRRHSAHVPNSGNNGNQQNQNRRHSNAHSNHRKNSNASTASSNNSSRHNSFSKAPGTGNGAQHPADLLRNVYTSSMMAAFSSSGEESPQVGRRRGGSLPITALQRSNGAHLSPNSSPPNGGSFVMIGPNGGARPKSNSYCEGAGPSTMSPWLQRRKASASSRLSSGELIFSGVVRQPRGPDGTKGFATGYRAMILQERLQQQASTAVSA